MLHMVDYELSFPCAMLANLKEHEFITIANEIKPIKPIKSTSRIQYLPQLTVKEALGFNDIEVLFIPGGFDRELIK